MRQHGFTLLELSIVIVIIGLIVAGISAGQSLVRQAQLRQITTDFNNYKVALNSFKLQYDALPGDMVNASSYWSANDGNGNGDIVCNETDPEENVLFWQHLQLAGLIEGDFSGDIPGCSTGTLLTLGVDVPEGALASSHYYLESTDSIFGRGNKHLLTLAGYHTNSTTNRMDGILLASEAKAIDEKMDDGSAVSGFVYGLKERDSWGAANRCTLLSYNGAGNVGWGTSSATQSEYYLAETTPRCILGFVLN